MKEYNEKIIFDESQDKNKVADDDSEFIDIETAYLKEIRKIPLLTEQEEKELVFKNEQGDVNAREKLIKSNLRLVVKITKRYLNRGIDFLDLVGAGNESLIKAVDKFCISMGCRFSTYATFAIDRGITRYIKNNYRSIRIPINVLDDIASYKMAKEDIIKQLGRVPSFDELSKILGITKNEIIEYETLQNRIVSLYDLIDEDQEEELIQFIPSDEKTPEDKFVDLELQEKLIELVEHKCDLTSKEIGVIMLYFGLKKGYSLTPRSIAKKYKCIEESVKRTLTSALLKIRKVKYIEEFVIYTSNPDAHLENKYMYSELNDDVSDKIKRIKYNN